MGHVKFCIKKRVWNKQIEELFSYFKTVDINPQIGITTRERFGIYLSLVIYLGFDPLAL